MLGGRPQSELGLLSPACSLSPDLDHHTLCISSNSRLAAGAVDDAVPCRAQQLRNCEIERYVPARLSARCPFEGFSALALRVNGYPGSLGQAAENSLQGQVDRQGGG